jgi:hypothetical protein
MKFIKNENMILITTRAFSVLIRVKDLKREAICYECECLVFEVSQEGTDNFSPQSISKLCLKLGICSILTNDQIIINTF